MFSYRGWTSSRTNNTVRDATGLPTVRLLFLHLFGSLVVRFEHIFSIECGLVHADADDLAVVVGNYISSLVVLALSSLQRFSERSGLFLNVCKLVSHFLGPSALGFGLRNLIIEIKLFWLRFRLEPCAKYIGFVVGPGKVNKFWDASFRRCSGDVANVGHLKRALFFGIVHF